MDFLSQFAPLDLFWIGLSLFLTGMGKGGFPVGAIALPVMILVWPAQSEAARQAVGFMLPMLCLMDAVAMLFYWRHVLWGRLLYLIPATLTGVALASFMFVSDHAMVAVSDRMIKICIGVLGILFVVYFAVKKWLLRHIHASEPNWTKGHIFGFTAGMTSTLAHAAGPVMQMYLLPQQLEKRLFAATSCAFFWMLNLVKLIPFFMMGRIQPDNLKLGAVLLPVIPLGVACGWWLTRRTEQRHYSLLIYAVLLVTSVSLIVKAL
ncbi:MAG: sulfite exporter TauE/SafE family protein [Pontiellaceae bacterium]|nr:sulfite exporter TauE/SafE family protein [Pontiellaceae bacterium]MBN2785459.1 sulfite exporter TauE/SafE family protein [Pontiellaceae bacterium]